MGLLQAFLFGVSVLRRLCPQPHSMACHCGSTCVAKPGWADASFGSTVALSGSDVWDGVSWRGGGAPGAMGWPCCRRSVVTPQAAPRERAGLHLATFSSSLKMHLVFSGKNKKGREKSRLRTEQLQRSCLRPTARCGSLCIASAFAGRY